MDTDTAAPEGETPNQRQARLRRERRAAKIQSEGASRLESIGNIGGRRIPPPDQPSTTQTTGPTPFKPASASSLDDTPDPDEVDISEHHYVPRTTPRPITPSQLQQWQGPPPSSQSRNHQRTDDAGQQDPMLQMMQQMLSGAGMDPNADPMAGMPPGFADMFNAMNGGMGGGVQAQVASTSSAYVWRIIHAIFSFSLALYITLTSSFTGSKAARTSLAGLTGDANDSHFGRNLFLWFATVEVALQSSRYVIEKGQLPQSGLMGTLSRLLPEPYAGYVRVFGRYSVIYNTVVADAMVVVFVLGLVAWWKGQVEV